MLSMSFRSLVVLAVVPAVFLSACAESELVIHSVKKLGNAGEPEGGGVKGTAEGTAKIGQPYEVAGVWYYPQADPGYDETGIASWYGEEFQGRQTANGEYFDMNRLSAAHKTLPMPSRVRVTNLENGRAIVLRVNDRGPFVNGRLIDVSRRAAQLLGFYRSGTARVRVQAASGPGGKKFVPKPVTPEAERIAVAAAPQAAVATQALPPPPGIPAAPAPVASAPIQPVAATVAATEAVTEAAPDGEVTFEPVRPTQLFVQAGAFAFVDNARRLSQSLSRIGPTKISVAQVDGRDLYRVRIGPLADVSMADAMLARLINSGYPGARIVVD